MAINAKKHVHDTIVKTAPAQVHTIVNPAPQHQAIVEQAKLEKQYGEAKLIEVAAAQAVLAQAQADANTAASKASYAETARETAKEDLRKATEAATKADDLATANTLARTDADKAEDERKKAEAAFNEAKTQAAAARTAANEANLKLAAVRTAADDVAKASTPADAKLAKDKAVVAAGEVAAELGKANMAAGLANAQVTISSQAVTDANAAYAAAVLADDPKKQLAITEAKNKAGEAERDAGLARDKATVAETVKAAMEEELKKATKAAESAQKLAGVNPDVTIRTKADAAEAERVKVQDAFDIAEPQVEATRKAADDATEQARIARKAADDAAAAPTSIEAEREKATAQTAAGSAATELRKANTAAGVVGSQALISTPAVTAAETAYHDAVVVDVAAGRAVKVAEVNTQLSQALLDSNNAELKAKAAETAKETAKKDLERATKAATDTQDFAKTNSALQTKADEAEVKRKATENAFKAAEAQATAARTAADAAKLELKNAEEAKKNADNAAITRTSVEVEAERVKAEEAATKIATKKVDADTAATEAGKQAGISTLAANAAEAVYKAAEAITKSGGTVYIPDLTTTPAKLDTFAELVRKAVHQKAIYDMAKNELKPLADALVVDVAALTDKAKKLALFIPLSSASKNLSDNIPGLTTLTPNLCTSKRASENPAKTNFCTPDADIFDRAGDAVPGKVKDWLDNKLLSVNTAGQSRLLYNSEYYSGAMKNMATAESCSAGALECTKAFMIDQWCKMGGGGLHGSDELCTNLALYEAATTPFVF